MQDSTPRSNLTPLQSMIFELSNFKFQKAQKTFYALPVEPDMANKRQQKILERNNQLMDRFGAICLGNQKHSETGLFKPISIESALLFIKEVQINNELIRLVYFPLLKWDLTGENGAVSYKKMVMQQMLLTYFLKPKLTAKHTLISLSYITLGREDSVLQLIPHMDKISKELVKIFKLDVPEIKTKMIYVICVNSKREEIFFEDQINRDKKIYVMANEGLFALDPNDQDKFGLKTEPTDLLKKDNYVTVAEIYKHFSYNEFVHFKATRSADLNLGLKISNEIWALFLAILHPIYKVKQIIYERYSLENVKARGDDLPAAYPSAEIWKSDYEIKEDFRKLNQIFRFEQWKKREDEPKNDLTGEKAPKPEEKRLAQFSQMIALNTEFTNEQDKFIHVMVLTQINNLCKQLEEQNKLLQSEPDFSKRFLLQNKILEFGKILVRLLGSLKDKKSSFGYLIQVLQGFEPKFYEHLLTIYANAHDEFCRANKNTFDKLFDLVRKVRQLRTIKLQMLKILKFNDQDIRWQQSKTHSLEQAKRKKKKLQIQLNLLLENETNEDDKDIKKKIFVVKFDLALTLKRLAFELDFGNKKGKYLKQALKIVFVDLYKSLFHENKNFNTEYPNGIGFNEDVLLEEASSLLKMMGNIDLSIELQKNMGNHMNVAEYYKLRLIPLRRQSEKDITQMQKIINQAILYFKAKHHLVYVSQFYDLLKKTGKTKEQRNKFENQRLDFQNDLSDPANKKKLVDAAKKKMFPLVDNSGNQNKDTVSGVVAVCAMAEEERGRGFGNSLIFEE